MEVPAEGVAESVTVGNNFDEGLIEGLYTGLREVGTAAVTVGTDVGELLIVALEQAKVGVAVVEPHVDVLHPVEPPHP